MSEEPVSLRPITEADLPILCGMLNDPEALGEFQWFGWRDPDRFRRRWAEHGLLGEEQWILAVVVRDEFCGFVAASRKGMLPTAPYWSIGAQLLPQARGRGIGTEGQRLLVDYLFAHTPVMRLEADTEVTNYAEQRALEKCGFIREGVQRAKTFRDGEWRDVVLYSLLRTDVRPA
ncbi:GNAT family N-acetyltransferase [Streptomyces kaniharaensis]|uniref:GNAT family N-acetyltransferase n=1 Tax=Streptomyces kaniharaensis TaxID=212423 RepID=A0A6N7KMP0_9ACTN|nr:GNAT family protein [Streptomyces kaniharaensis]MQS11728.1 GNAT family N-acetyltransferase [Streptomyces kaniharaensis]